MLCGVPCDWQIQQELRAYDGKFYHPNLRTKTRYYRILIIYIQSGAYSS